MGLVTTDDKYYMEIANTIRINSPAQENSPFRPGDMAGAIVALAEEQNSMGYSNGFDEGMNEGYKPGYDNGLADGKEIGKQEGKIELLQASKYMNATASGAAVGMRMVSPVNHNVVDKVSSKNLLPPLVAQSKNGITLNFNEDNTVILGGTATEDTFFPFGEIAVESGQTYCLSGISNGDWYTYNTYFYINDEYFADIGSGKVFTVPDGVNSILFSLFVKQGVVLDDVLYKPQLEMGSTATDYTPYVADLSQEEVKRYGKNLFKLKDYTFTATNAEGTIENGVLTINYTGAVGTSTPLSASRLTANYVGLSQYPAGTYTFCVDAIQDQYHTQYPYLEIKLADGTTGKLEGNVPTTISQPFKPNALKLAAVCNMEAGDSYTTTLQIVCGDVSNYEPYVEPTTYAVAADGMVDVPSLAPSTTVVASAGTVLECSYLRDIDAYIDNLMVDVALTGGE